MLEKRETAKRQSAELASLTNKFYAKEYDSKFIINQKNDKVQKYVDNADNLACNIFNISYSDNSIKPCVCVAPFFCFLIRNAFQSARL